MRLVINEEKCVVCGACAVACMDQNDIEINQKPYILPQRVEQDKKVRQVITVCRHCSDPACMKACEKGSIFKDENGFVVYDTASCNGCGFCKRACPFGAIELNIVRHNAKIAKCDGCSMRVKEGMLPACVKNCPMDAIVLEK